MSYIKNLKDGIRKSLKELGYNSRKVSVREDSGGLSWCIRITIKDENVDEQAVKEIAQKAKKIDRCEVTGEILGGGNTYVFVTGYRGFLV
jgi:hypothetical protein